MKYHLAEVFSERAPEGKGIAVMLHKKSLKNKQPEQTAKKLRQSESIFLQKLKEDEYNARLYDMNGEARFSADSFIAAGASIHEYYFRDQLSVSIILHLENEDMKVTSTRLDKHYEVSVVGNKGKAMAGKTALFAAGTMIPNNVKRIYVEKRA